MAVTGAEEAHTTGSGRYPKSANELCEWHLTTWRVTTVIWSLSGAKPTCR
jgi:hypothetical protein